jgi:L-methionine (R)-S-oxide reductase
MSNGMDPSLLLSLQEQLRPQEPLLGRLLNAFSLLKDALGERAWVGLYLYDEKNKALLLGPFVGTPACEKIPLNKGVVGACYRKEKEILVPDVLKFPGYISCDALVKSEACFPLYKNQKIIGVFDLDFAVSSGYENDLPLLRKVASLLNDYPLF